MAVDFHENRTDAESDGDDLMSLFHKVLGSCNINFLFGAGVDGGPRGAIPSFDSFADTITELKQLGLPYADGIEKALQSCDDDNKRRQVLDKFVEEFNSKQDYSLTHPSLVNLQNLLKATHKAVSLAENRHPESKRVNIFTLNYDRIIEELLDASGFFNYVLKKETKSFLPFDVVGYDTGKRAFVPTFAVYKLHGSVNANRVLNAGGIVFPGQDKLGSVISNFYETLFAMKGELLRKNAALFVIGYSWSDEHINDAIDSAIDNGLTVMWPQYEAGDSKLLPDKLKSRVIVVPPADSANPCDTTATLANLFEQAMA